MTAIDAEQLSSHEWACGAAGSALPWHGRGRRFDPDQVHQIPQPTSAADANVSSHMMEGRPWSIVLPFLVRLNLQQASIKKPESADKHRSSHRNRSRQ